MNKVINRKTKFYNLGLKDYKESWDYQADLFDKILAVKIANRNPDCTEPQPTSNYLLFVEHPHVFTLGKSGEENNLLIKKEDLHTIQATYYHINRGGDITYHGPGQIVGYPVIDLENFFTDIHQYLRLLEEAVIQTVREFGISAGRIPGLTGVWVDHENQRQAKKICALGVKTSRWVTMHGFAFNVNTDLRYFDYIIPCGIADKSVTSLANVLGTEQDIQKVSEILKQRIAHLFKMELVC